ncbi:amino acid ABC transporter permease [Luteipulveratus halotolerans]|uniref:ABC transporter permease n=1 Tax=Luteipulveratus halotolerans TaxID=1631356 RepID=A0A0L6CGE2_9MICO|nr:amino acid ABC transporter permease [Luteipulveratus halotolerans]KNX36588.1 ABC transporter permease [Luteipulveratus halotolerans]
MSSPADAAAGTPGPATPDTERPGKIDARPVRHPWRWVALAVIAVLIAMMISSFVTNEKWDWEFVPKVMRYNPVLEGLVKGTIVATIGAMVIGVVLGVLLAIMRLSDNPVLKGVAFVYTWFFRAVPRLVLLVMLGAGAAYLYPTLDIGVPFGKEFAGWLGLSSDLTIGSLDVNDLSKGIWVGIIGLGLSEAAYMAEIARAGIMSVDKGQSEAAQAIGMSPGKTMRRVVLPQAMRVIVPPTGNETIAMVKDTSLMFAVPISMELWFQVDQVANTQYRIMGAYVAGCIWYLILGTILMIGQYFLERRFGRGFGATAPGAGRRAIATPRTRRR